MDQVTLTPIDLDDAEKEQVLWLFRAGYTSRDIGLDMDIDPSIISGIVEDSWVGRMYKDIIRRLR